MLGYDGELPLPALNNPIKPAVLWRRVLTQSYPRCRTPQSHSSRTPGTLHHSASRLSALPHCTLSGDSGTNGLSLSWAEAQPWPQAWWGRPEKWGTDREPSISLGVTPDFGIIPGLSSSSQRGSEFQGLHSSVFQAPFHYRSKQWLGATSFKPPDAPFS